MVKISASFLSADLSRLGDEIGALDKAGADYIHVDVMDGRFVPNLTIGPPVIKSIRKCTEKPFDVHLMISEPELSVDAYAAAGADIITVHPESAAHLDRLLGHIRGLGRKAGVALNPSTPEEVLRYVLDKIDLVLVMTVNPGFGGQEFIPAQLEKIRRIRDMIGGRNVELEVDGGITPETGRLCVEAGADVLVAGSYITDGGVYAAKINALRGGL